MELEIGNPEDEKVITHLASQETFEHMQSIVEQTNERL